MCKPMMGSVMERLICLSSTFCLFMVFVFLSGCGGETSSSVCEGVSCGNGSCYEDGGKAHCFCDPGYYQDGLDCLPDPCIPDPCRYGFCRIVNGLPFCQCDAGYAGDRCGICADGYEPYGGLCVQGDPCLSDPCVYGRCSVNEGVAECSCFAGYAGDYCDLCAEGHHPENLACVPNTACSPNPCINGICRASDGETYCECDPGYTGSYCEDCTDGYARDGLDCVPLPGDPCDPNPCTEPHRTVCSDLNGEAGCACDEGYTFNGTACVVEADPCDPNPCEEENRNVCIPSGEGYACACNSGYRDDGQGNCVLDTSPIQTRVCGVTVRYRDQGSGPIYIRGTFNGWSLDDQLARNGDIWEITISDLPPGDYAYKLYNAALDEWFVDNDNPYTIFADGVRNSRLRVPDCARPLMRLDSEPTVVSGSVGFTVSASYGENRVSFDSAAATVRRNGVAVDGAYNPENGVFSIDDEGMAPGKYSYRFNIADVHGNRALELFVPVWVEDRPFDWRDAVLYFVLTDRFMDGDQSNNSPVSDSQLDWKANWQGGDFAGTLAKIEDGYFTDLGVNTLWISSPVMNTEGAFWGSDGRKYSGYHSYWPIATGWTDENPLPGVSPVDPHFGTVEDLTSLVEAAHARGIRVIVDFVANHVHADSPLYEEHLYDPEAWFHWNDGQAGSGYVCGWERPIDCWFAEYLPDFEYKNLDVMKRVMDHAVWLVKETNVDGFRLDAVKHMILDFSHTLRARLDEEIDTTEAQRFYMVGETFTGEGDGARQTIRSYVASNLLDGQFDFPLFWATLSAFVRHERGLDSLDSFLESNTGYYGADAVMSNFIGNHDVPRAISHADHSIGDMWGNGAKEQGWSNPPGAPSDETPFKRLRQAWTFMFTIQGIPLIYYGDEIGIPGAGDPDNRRMMVFGGDLTTHQRVTLEHVQKLGLLRLAHPAFRYGERLRVVSEADYLAYVMKQGADSVLVVFNRSGGEITRTLEAGGAWLPDGQYRDAIGGGNIDVSGGRATLSLSGMESAVYELVE